MEGTRVAVHDVVGLHANGSAIDDVSREFPALTGAQVCERPAYYEDHKPDINRWVAEQIIRAE